MKHFSDYYKNSISQLMKKHKSFFAFSTKQFEESKDSTLMYVHMGNNMYCPEKNVEQCIKDMSQILTNSVCQDVQENGAEKIIEREYFNHECQISLDTQRADAALSLHIEKYPELFSEETCSKVYKSSFDYAVKHNLF